MMNRLVSSGRSPKLFLTVFACFFCLGLAAQNDSLNQSGVPLADTVAVLPTHGISLGEISGKFSNLINKVPLQYVKTSPYISLQQMLKGNAAGVYIQEPSGEP